MSKFNALTRDSVVSVDSKDECFFEGNIVIVEDVGNALLDGIDESCHAWFKEGVKCKVMSPSFGGWITGKVRFTLEFEKDE